MGYMRRVWYVCYDKLTSSDIHQSELDKELKNLTNNKLVQSDIIVEDTSGVPILKGIGMHMIDSHAYGTTIMVVKHN